MGTAGSRLRRALALLASLIFMGCTAAPQTITIEKPVPIPGPFLYVSVPDYLFTGCAMPPKAGPLNGDLLLHDHAMVVYAACLEGELAQIKVLK